MSDDEFNILIEAIVNDYFSVCKYEPLKLSVVFANDIWETYFTVRPDHKERLAKQQPLPAFNGTVVAPQELDGTFTVIIDNQYFVEECKKNTAAWVGTIIHEVTHAVDYRNYARIIRASNYDEVLDTSRHRMFQLWTEFNAKRHGYYFLRKHSNLTDEGQIPDIINRELPGQMAYMTEEYNSTSDGWQQIYAVSQFLGRLAVWEDLFPSCFNRDFVKKVIGTNPWMLELYDYLNTHRDINAAVESFEELRKIVQKNFQGI